MLTPQAIDGLSNQFLHRFEWLNDAEIGELPLDWNWLVMEYPGNDNAALLHYTIGTPCFEIYQNCDNADLWWNEYKNSQEGKDA
jgi:hypothetical protein